MGQKKRNKPLEEERCCEECGHYNTDRDDQPCCYCFDYIHFEKGVE